MNINAYLIEKPRFTLLIGRITLLVWGAKTDISNVLWFRIIRLEIAWPPVRWWQGFITKEELLEILTMDREETK